MKRLVLATAVTVAAMAAGMTAQAMPIPLASQQDTSIVRIADGCGPGGHRDGFGRCVPNYRRFYRGCPPGFHLNPYGRCRPNF